MSGEAARVDAWVVRLSSLGDVVHALALRRALETLGLRVGWVVEERFAGVLEHLLDAMPVLRWDRTRRGMRALREAAGRARFALDVQGNWKSALVSRALGAELRVAPARRDLRERSAFFVPADLRARPCEGPHVLDRGLTVASRVAEACGAPPRTRAELGEPAFLGASPEPARASLRAIGVTLRPTTRVVVLQAPEDPRSIPTASIRALAAAEDVVCVAGPRESELAWPEELRVLRQGRGSLPELISLGTLTAELGAPVLGPDCGASHVLRACGARVTYAFGPQDPLHTGPIDGQSVLTRDVPLPCQPCRSRSCRLPEGPLCMQMTLMGSDPDGCAMGV